MEKIISMEDALKEFREKEESEVEQFTNPKIVKEKISAGKIILRQFLIALLAILFLVIFKLMMPDLYEQINDFINVRFSINL